MNSPVLTMLRKMNVIRLVVIICLVIFGLFVWSVGMKRICKKRIQTTPRPEHFIYKMLKGDSFDKRYLLLSPYRLSRWQDGQLLIIDKGGKIYYQKNLIGAAICFRQWVFNGRKYYSYLADDHRVYHIPIISLAAGKAVILDSNFHEIKRLGFVPSPRLHSHGNEGIDLHDLLMLGEDHFLTLAEIGIPVYNVPDSLHPAKGLELAVPVLQELVKGKVIWQWVASDYPELYGSSVKGNFFYDARAKHDYLHINSVFLDPADSNLICSFRHADQVIKINRKTGAIMWKLGGNSSDFPLADDQAFYKQHSVVITNAGELLMFDNGDQIKRKRTRIIWMRLDEKNKKVVEFHSYLPEIPFSMYMGSAKKNGDTLLVAGGTANYLLEVNVRTGEKLFELHSNMALYRVYEINDITGVPSVMDQSCVRSEEDTMIANMNK